MKARIALFLLLLPQCVLAGPVIVVLGGNETELVATVVGEFRPAGHLEMWFVDTDTADLGGELPFEFMVVDTGVLGPPQHGGGGGGGQFITITELPLGDGRWLAFNNPVVWRRGYLESNDGEGEGEPQLVQEKLKMISGATLLPEESDFTLDFFSDTEFAVTTHFRGVITENYTVVPEPATMSLLAFGAVAAALRRR